MAGDVTITARLDGFTRVQHAIGGVSNELRRAGEIADRQRQRWEKFSQAAATAGRALIGFGAAAAGSAGVAVKFAADWEESFANVRKTVDGTEAELNALGGQIQTLSRTIPISANELANLAGVAGQLGIETENIAEFTETAAKLGVATNLSSEQAAVGLSRLANIAGTSQGDIDRLGSTIVQLGNNMATTESEILEMSLRLGGAGRQIGLAESETIAFAAALSSVGVRAEAGGTAFSRVFANMQSAVKSGGEELSGFAKVAGQSVGEFQRLFERDASEAVVQFVEGLDRISQSGGNVFQVLDQVGLGGIRVRDALLRTAGATDELRKALRLGNAEWNENTALTEEARKRFETFTSQLKLLVNDIKAVAVAFGTTLFDPLEKVINFFRRVANVLLSLPDAWKAWTIRIIGAAGALATFLGSLGLLASILPTIWGLITAGAALLFSSFIPAIASAAAGIATFLLELLGVIGVATIFVAGIKIIIDNFQNLLTLLSAVGEWFGAFGSLIADVMNPDIGLDEAISNFLSNTLAAEKKTREAWNGLADGVESSVDKMVEDGKQAFNELSSFAKEKWSDLGGFFEKNFVIPGAGGGKGGAGEGDKSGLLPSPDLTDGLDQGPVMGGAEFGGGLDDFSQGITKAEKAANRMADAMEILKDNMSGISTAGQEMAKSLTKHLIATTDLSAELAAAVSQSIAKTFDQVTQGIGNATAQAIVFGEDIGESFKTLIQNIGAQIIQMIVTTTLRRIAMQKLSLAQEKSIAAQRTLISAKEAAVGAFMWTMKEIPVPLSFVLAPIFAASAFAGTMALGAFAGGVDEVPDTGSFVLHRGERVVQPKANRDLTDFLNRPESRMGGGGMAVNVTFEGPVITDGPGVNQIADMLARRIERQQRRRI